MEVFDTVPPVIWYIRRQMRTQRKCLSMPQFRALFMIRSRPAASLSAVAEHLGASLPTASRLVAGLQSKGLVKRSDCEDDRRQLELVITPQGDEVLDSAREATLTRMREEMAGLDDGQRDLIARAMRLLHGLFEPELLSGGGSGRKRAAGTRRGKQKATPSL